MNTSVADIAFAIRRGATPMTDDLRLSFEPARSLKLLVDAATLVQMTATSGPVAREAAFMQVYEASSQVPAAGAKQYYQNPEETSPDDLDMDWESAASAANMELKSAQVLLAVAAERGEIPAPTGLDASIFLRSAVEDAQNELQASQNLSEKKRFSKEVPSVHSENLDSAIQAFRTSAGAAVVKILDESDRVVSFAFEEIKKNGQDALQSLLAFTQVFSGLEKLKGFLQLAWAKVLSAFDLLRKFLKQIPEEKIRDILSSINDKVSVRDGLEWAYKIADVKKSIDDLRLRPTASPNEIDSANEQISKLARQFESFSKVMRSLGTTISVVGLILLAHISGPWAALGIPAANAVIASVTVVAGMDYIGRIHLARKLNGVVQIIDTLALDTQVH
jgi:hypothetical protein